LPSQENPHKQLEAKELESRLQQAVLQLPEKQRAVFVMRYFDGMRYEEISKVLKTSVGGLKANYFHALKKVQEYLKDETTQTHD
jgi:RNA polymerase sigma-70 factor (ECF subfamily)